MILTITAEYPKRYEHSIDEDYFQDMLAHKIAQEITQAILEEIRLKSLIEKEDKGMSTIYKVMVTVLDKTSTIELLNFIEPKLNGFDFEKVRHLLLNKPINKT